MDALNYLKSLENKYFFQTEIEKISKELPFKILIFSQKKRVFF
jgi:hypothetical protein